ncbi:MULTISPECIES: recombinase family protein [unclassified Caballeronia]|uniref:recombinase family protein n=1 Tax=unclassified Caballeronia TaxID=2646786 RepID=UPI003F50210C
MAIELRGNHSAYHSVIKLLQHPVYAGAYVFGRKSSQTHVVDGRPRKGSPRSKPMQSWNVLLEGHHPGYVTCNEFEENQKMIA